MEFQEREELLHILATMPDEAYLWLVAIIAGGPNHRGSGQVWPDGLGGFLSGSRRAILMARKAAKAYLERKS